MFSSKMREEKEKTVVIKGITPSAMTLILDYIYTDIITLTDDNVGEVLQAASLLTILELQDIIKEYLVEALKPSTCLFFRDLGSLYSLENVVVEANKCLKENFEEVSTQSDFCNLEVAELEYLISSDEIMVKDECKVFEAILIWIKHDDENRKKYFFGLFIHVRLQLISLYYLSDKVRTEALVRESSECRDLVEDAFHFHADPNRFKFQSLRRGQEKGAINNFILCYGGLGLILYNPSKEMWIRWNLPSQPDLSYSTPVSFGNGTAFCGSDTGPSTKVTLFDGNDFLPMPPMVKARAKASADCVFGDILIFGGELSSIFTFPSDGHSSGFRSIADDFEIYEPGKKQWKIAGKLPNGPRSEAATVVVKESVYLLGGFQSIEDRGPSHYYSRASKDGSTGLIFIPLRSLQTK
ncbi:unnamed protein product [Clavelina lepadiformis]|uniref:BTB domain-containing protein n=1 Tax=Clavelina lepadiformis TaxID=159417 RepID=A0ABP0GBC5_CLALP